MVTPETITRVALDKPMLDQKQYPAEQVQALQKCFALYVRFPKSRWNDIKRAEVNTIEGRKIYAELKEEYMEKYLSTEISVKDQSCNVADLEYGLEQV